MPLPDFTRGPVTSATFPLFADGTGHPGEVCSVEARPMDTATDPRVMPVQLSLEPPILDLRRRKGSRQLWSGRLLTIGLWVGGAWLMGAAVTVGLTLAALPVLLNRRKGGTGSLPGFAGATVQEDLPRQALADVFGVAESTLFRARHARSNTIHDNEQGDIVAIESREPGVSFRAVGPRQKNERHAHPVG